jgi:peptide/nickel transport system ATP-binding protein
MQPNNYILDIKDLTVEFSTDSATTIAVNNCTFQLQQGETLALVGESGSGKSVTALSILQLLPSPPAKLTSGSIIFTTKKGDSIDISKLSHEGLEKIRGNEIGFIFQEPMTSLNPLMPCGKQVAESLMLHKNLSYEEATQKTIELFEDVKLPNPASIIHRFPHELSGGQKQRVMIAMAICCEPNLLIADEPTTALDVTVQKVILELLKELQVKYNMAMLFITHDLSLVKSIADKVVVMYKSNIVEYDTASVIFESPKHAYTKGLIACRPTMDERVKTLRTVSEIMETTIDNFAHDKKNIITHQDFIEKTNKLQTGKAILEINDLHVWYPTKTNFFGKTTDWFKAVQGVNLTIHQGETMGLVGESGCGKSTIGKTIVKLVETTKGHVLYKGKDISTFSKSDLRVYRKEVQIIFQDPYSSLNPRITIGEAIKEPMDIHGLGNANERKEKTFELLTKVNLLPMHFNRYPHEFSGGQRQRICIARALALQPQFIICDESVSALDISVQAQVLNLLVSLRDEFDLSYLFISHDLGVVKHISDRIAVMHKGQIIEINNADDLYNHPTATYTSELIASTF